MRESGAWACLDLSAHLISSFSVFPLRLFPLFSLLRPPVSSSLLLHCASPHPATPSLSTAPPPPTAPPLAAGTLFFYTTSLATILSLASSPSAAAPLPGVVAAAPLPGVTAAAAPLPGVIAAAPPLPAWWQRLPPPLPMWSQRRLLLPLPGVAAAAATASLHGCPLTSPKLSRRRFSPAWWRFDL